MTTIIRGRRGLQSFLHLTTDINAIVEALPPDDLLLAPATMRADDAIVAAIRERLTGAGVAVPRRLTRFRRVNIGTPGTTIGAVRLPETILAAGALVCVVDLDRLPASGPFALDLLARFAAPRDRLRLAASRGRTSLVAEVNLARPFDRVILATTADTERLWLTTDDLICGELTALALSEQRLPANRERINPWEDGVVQRATELSLGARYPGDIRLISDDGAVTPAMVETTTALQLRMGIDF